jgi:putative transcriptional regulator
MGALRKGRINARRVDATTDAEIEAQAAEDARELGIDFNRLEFHAVPHVPNTDVAMLRKRLGLTQADFASNFGLNLRTVQQWEQGRATPDLPARVLLRTIAEHPGAVRSAVWPPVSTKRGVRSSRR